MGDLNVSDQQHEEQQTRGDHDDGVNGFAEVSAGDQRVAKRTAQKKDKQKKKKKKKKEKQKKKKKKKCVSEKRSG